MCESLDGFVGVCAIETEELEQPETCQGTVISEDIANLKKRGNSQKLHHVLEGACVWEYRRNQPTALQNWVKKQWESETSKLLEYLKNDEFS